MKRHLSVFLIICLLCTMLVFPVKAQTNSAVQDRLYYEFDFSKDKLYTNYSNPVMPEGITYKSKAVSSNGISVFSYAQLDGKDALYLRASNSYENVVFTPLKEDGTPIALKPDTKYCIEWEFYITRFAGSWARPYIELYTSTDGITGYMGIAASRKETDGTTVYPYADEDWTDDPKSLAGSGSLLGYKRQLSYWHNGSSFGSDTVLDAYVRSVNSKGENVFTLESGNQYDSGVSYEGKKFSYSHTVKTPSNQTLQEDFGVTANADGSYTYSGRTYNNFFGLSLPNGYGEYYLKGYDAKATQNIMGNDGNYYHRSYSEYYITGLKIYEIPEEKTTVTLLDGMTKRTLTGKAGSELILPSTRLGADSNWYTSPDASLSSVCTLTEFPEEDITLYSAGQLVDSQKIDGGENTDSVFSQEYTVTDSDSDGNYELYYDSPEKKAEGYASNRFRLGKVEDKTTYKISVTYKATGGNLGFCFYTANSDDCMKYSTSLSKDAVYKIDSATDGYVTATMFITTYLMGQLTGTDTDDIKTVYGDTLYFGIKDSDASGNSDIYIKDIKYENVGNAVLSGGVSALTDEAYSQAGKQAMRYYFGYKTDDGSQLYIGDTAYKVVRRGFLYTDGGFNNISYVDKATVDSDSLTAFTKEQTAGMTVGSNKEYVNRFIENNFNTCWDYDSASKVMSFSTYITGFDEELFDKKLMVRGYVTVLVDGAEMTLYSNAVNRSVNSIKERKLVWSEDFGVQNISQISTFTQRYDTMYSYDSNLVTSTSENNYFVDSQTGELVLRITSDGNKNYTTAKSVTTRGIMSFKYGYLEMRAKVPYQKCVWPSFWLQPNKSSWNDAKYIGEIDILEVFSSNTTATANLHKWYLDPKDNTYKTDQIGARGNILYGNGSRNYVFSSNKEANKYHTYGFEWTEEFMAFYVDGKLYYKVSITEEDDYSKDNPGMDCFHKYYYICLNNWLYTQEQTYAPSSYWVENNADFGSVDYRIDYIRLYQRSGEEIIYQ